MLSDPRLFLLLLKRLDLDPKKDRELLELKNILLPDLL